MTGGGLRIATRLDFATLDELEAGFADRLSDAALFLARPLLGKAPDELYVGAPVHIDIETQRGEKALSVEGVVAWSYPAHPHTPPGREPGAGIVIDRFADDDSKARAARMLKKPGAGGRVRAPGSRLHAKVVAGPRPVSGKFAMPPGLAKPAPAAAPAPATLAPSTLPPRTATPAPMVLAPLPRTTTPAPVVTLIAPPLVPPLVEGPPPLPASLLAPPTEPLSEPPTEDGAPAPAQVHVDEATGELVVPMPPAPQPRVMAMGMFVDQSFDPTPTPKPLPSLEESSLPSAPQPAVQRLPALPFAGLLAQLEPPEGADVDVAPPPPMQADAQPDAHAHVEAPPEANRDAAAIADEAATMPPNAAEQTVEGPRPISLEQLPDAAPAPHAFEQRQTDVDLLVSLEDADFFPAELEEQRARSRAATNLRAKRTPSSEREDTIPLAPSPSAPPPVNPALVEETVTSWAQLDDLPSAEAEVELVSDDDVEALDDSSSGTHAVSQSLLAHQDARAEHADDSAHLPGPPVALEETTRRGAIETARTDSGVTDEVPGDSEHGRGGLLDSVLDGTSADETLAPGLHDEATGDHDTRDSGSVPSLESNELRTAEHSAIVLPESSLPSHEETRELDMQTQRGAAVRSTSEAAVEGAEPRTSEAADGAPRALPSLPGFEPPDEPEPGPIGVAFLVSVRRGPEMIHAVDPFPWPRSGTKRWNALDAAREEGNEAALDAAVASSPWLSRDASAAAAFEAPNLTDPGVRVADVVTKAVALAAEDDDGSVFSDGPSPAVRPAMRPGPSEATEADDGTHETTSDDAFAPLSSPRAADGAGADPEDEIDTERDMKRPPSKASPEAQARLGVLQRFLGRR